MNERNKRVDRPEKNFKVGAVRAAVWPTTIVLKDGTSFEKKKVVVDRRYKDRNGEWKSTHSLDANDVPKAILALQQAYEYIMTPADQEKEKEKEKEKEDETNVIEEVVIR